MKVVGNPSIAGRIEQAFQKASSRTGTSFDYLLQAAARESSLDPSANAKTSSASGLFQFIESTWLETLKRNGDELGLQDYAKHIRVDENGRYRVDNKHLKQQLLDLRNDPEVSALVAGAFTRNNASGLQSSLGREPSAGEVYLAHFLGVRGSLRLIAAAAEQPEQSAADLFPMQARANKPVFYAKDGQARSVAKVHDLLVKRFDVAMARIEAQEPQQAETATATPRAKEPERIESRILTAWRATAQQKEAPFEALFRADAAEQVALSQAVSETKTSGFAAQEVSENAGAVVPKPRPAGAPFDLTRFLSPTQSSGKSLSKKV